MAMGQSFRAPIVLMMGDDNHPLNPTSHESVSQIGQEKLQGIPLFGD
jgi:hypothetical protein